MWPEQVEASSLAGDPGSRHRGMRQEQDALAQGCSVLCRLYAVSGALFRPPYLLSWPGHDARGRLMSKLNYEQLAVAALDALLGGGLEITQHYYEPDPNEWYFKGPMGNVGP